MMEWPLTNDERAKYLAWVLQNNVPLSNDYDMQGFWKAANSGDPRVSASVNPNDGRMHFTDMFKLPNHPSFSAESKYATPNAPHWQGGLLPGGGESWTLAGDNGVVASEAPWNKGGIRYSGLLGGN